MPTYVEYGVADCGIAGRDVLLEADSDVYEPLDLRLRPVPPVVAAARGVGLRLPPRVHRARGHEVPEGRRRGTSWSAACRSRS